MSDQEGSQEERRGGGRGGRKEGGWKGEDRRTEAARGDEVVDGGRTHEWTLASVTADGGWRDQRKAEGEVKSLGDLLAVFGCASHSSENAATSSNRQAAVCFPEKLQRLKLTGGL